MEGNAVYTEARRILDDGEAKGIIGAIQMLIKANMSREQISGMVCEQYHLEQERFEDLFQKATENKD